MTLTSKTKLDPSLQELIENKPSSILKLLATWDDLSKETQIKILFLLKEKIPIPLKDKALASDNAYIRSLVANNAYFDKEDPEDQRRIEKILKDESPLVKYSQDSTYSSGFIVYMEDIKPEAFFSIPQEKRIAILSHEGVPSSHFVEILEWAIENTPIAKNELADLVEEFLKKPELHRELTRESFDGEDSYYQSKLLEDLWNLVPKINGRSALLMIKFLPLKSDGFENFPENIIPLLEDYQLRTLFYRKDAQLEDIRKKIFLSSDEKYSDFVRIAAASYHLDLSKKEFHEILTQNKTKIIELLIQANQYSSNEGLSPVYLLALDDIKKNLRCYDYRHLYDEEKIIKLLKKDTEWGRKRAVFEIALYRLSNYFVPYDKSKKAGNIERLGQQFHFLANVLIPNDTWATYIAFSNVNWSDSNKQKILIEFADEFVHNPEFYPENPWPLFVFKEIIDEKLIERRVDCLYQEIKKIGTSLEYVNRQLRLLNDSRPWNLIKKWLLG